MYRVEDYPEIRDAFLLKSRGQGASRSLRGKVGIITCFMKRHKTDFDQKTKDEYYRALHEAMRRLESEAQRYGVPLKFSNYEYDIDVPADADPRDDFKLIKDYLRSETMEELQSNLEGRMGYDEMPFILVYDESARSFARTQWADSRFFVNECSTVFRSYGRFDWGTIAHELLHQFGAQDLYFPEQLKACAERYLGKSIMGVGGSTVDDFTAYLIGWKNTISANSYWFIKETSYLTEELYCKAIEDAWKS